MTLPTSTTDEQLDEAILVALREFPGETAPWSILREKLPAASNWRNMAALVGLHTAGQVHAIKIGGSTWIALSIVMAA
ncbi:hypothetical protein [Mycobacterium vicinigordonae]|uniref:Uncharacterized protein n=1 Tax=Mycobacterium vicinigordonae TaxID=1719132 RepID=A0A7D6E1T2_9MYCO|nr:hypothetical protein [Mycobacterium vicinigordonae]QLL08850.1 hypothetical protein H0P51_08075 [Mycobacterium vicinigordonae]